MDERKLGWMGICAVVLFWAALFLFGSLRPGYSQMARAVSELGALGTPLMAAWNVVGFGLPGLLLMIFGWRLGRVDGPRAWFVPGLLAFGGASFLFSGVFPADMQDLRGTVTQLHILASMLSLIWLPGALMFAWRRFHDWRAASVASATLALLFLLSMGLPDSLPRGLTQRLRFAIYLGWVLAMGFLLLRRAGRRRDPA
jgi:hypothetical membrane protein